MTFSSLEAEAKRGGKKVEDEDGIEDKLWVSGKSFFGGCHAAFGGIDFVCAGCWHQCRRKVDGIRFAGSDDPGQDGQV